MQLLKITTKPIEYKMEVDRATLKVPEPEFPPEDIVTPPSKVNANAGYRADESTFRKKEKTQPEQTTGVQAYHPGMVKSGVMSASTDAVSYQNTIPVETRYQYQTANMDAILARVASATVDRSWEPETAVGKSDSAANHVGIDEAIPKLDSELEYTPGEVRIDIESLAEVDVEYLGGPNYFPKSSDPDYDPEQNK